MHAGALRDPQQGARFLIHKPTPKRHGKARRCSHVRVGIAHHLMQPGKRKPRPSTQTAVNLRSAKQERWGACPLRLKA